GDAYGLSIDREFIVGQIEAQSIPFLAFKAGKSALFAILARMLEVGKRPLFLHPPVVGKGLSQMAKLLLRCAFGDLIAPGELLALDPVILRLEVAHVRPCSLSPVRFPASKGPVIGLACHPTGFAKVD